MSNSDVSAFNCHVRRIVTLLIIITALFGASTGLVLLTVFWRSQATADFGHETFKTCLARDRQIQLTIEKDRRLILAEKADGDVQSRINAYRREIRGLKNIQTDCRRP